MSNRNMPSVHLIAARIGLPHFFRAISDTSRLLVSENIYATHCCHGHHLFRVCPYTVHQLSDYLLCTGFPALDTRTENLYTPRYSYMPAIKTPWTSSSSRRYRDFLNHFHFHPPTHSGLACLFLRLPQRSPHPRTDQSRTSPALPA